MIKKILRLALLQLDFEFGEVDKNLKKSFEYIDKAVGMGSNFICLPEGFNTGYDRDRYPEMLAMGEEIDDSTIIALREKAAEKGVYILAPTTLKVMNGIYENTAVLINDKGLVQGTYSKTHLSGAEQLYYKRGSKYPVFQTDFGNIGIVICYDVCFPETTRILAIEGADIVFVPAAWRTGFEKWWDINISCRAIDNTVYMAAVNRVGEAKSSSFMGKSKVVNPKGEVEFECNGTDESICYCEIDLNTLDEERKMNTVLIDRHPDDYKQLSKNK